MWQGFCRYTIAYDLITYDLCRMLTVEKPKHTICPDVQNHTDRYCISFSWLWNERDISEWSDKTEYQSAMHVALMFENLLLRLKILFMNFVQYLAAHKCNQINRNFPKISLFYFAIVHTFCHWFLAILKPIKITEICKQLWVITFQQQW